MRSSDALVYFPSGQQTSSYRFLANTTASVGIYPFEPPDVKAGHFSFGWLAAPGRQCTPERLCIECAVEFPVRLPRRNLNLRDCVPCKGAAVTRIMRRVRKIAMTILRDGTEEGGLSFWIPPVEKNQESQGPLEAKTSQERRSERVKLSIPIRVMRFGGSTGDFVEDTQTVVLNHGGALIALKHRVSPDETIRIINLENLYEADFRVVGLAQRAEGETSTWGVECLEKERSIWQIDFPAPIELKSSKAGALLICQGCAKQALLVLGPTEVNILESTGTLERLCETCGQLSTWAYADITRLPKAADSPMQPPVSPEVGKWDGKTERRLDKRRALKLPVLVRNARGEQEIVKTENLSRKGLAVCLRMALSVGEIVTVICPYSGGGQELEQKAEVRYRAPQSPARTWYYGIRYAPK
jgi:hypothetical protein